MLPTWLHFALEGIILLLAAVTPWAFGGIEPFAVFGIHILVGLLILFWCLAIVVQRSFPWPSCLFLMLWSLLTLFTVFQLIPMPNSILRIISPKSLETQEFFYPHHLEQIQDHTLQHEIPQSFSISLLPGETRIFLMQCLVLLVIFTVVRTYLANRGVYIRLAWICLINAAALSLLGLLQFFSSPRDFVYWSFQAEGAGVFSSFICRTHFAMYANLCFGLGLSLFYEKKKKENWGGDSYFEVLQNPKKLWLISLMALVMVGVGFSLSRGGVLALVGSALLVLILQMKRQQNRIAISSIVWVVPITGLLFAWIGSKPVESRLDTLASKALTEDGRWNLWKDSLRLLPDYPLFGTGGGTFDRSEAMVRKAGPKSYWSLDHAHNEYLEALTEGGIVRFILITGMIWIIFRSIIPVIRKTSSSSIASVLQGGLFSLLALSFQSFFDFGVHIPAVAILAMIIVGMMLGISEREQIIPRQIKGPVIVLPIVLLLALGYLLIREGWSVHQAARYRNIAREIVAKEETNELVDLRIQLLQAAVKSRPNDPLYWNELGQAYTVKGLRFPLGDEKRIQMIRQALQAWVLARDLGPLLPQPHARIGSFRRYLSQGDAEVDYYERARKLAPRDSFIWFLCGQQKYNSGSWDDAWEDWNQSLQLDSEYIHEIVSHASQKLSSEELMNKILPDSWELVLDSVTVLFPNKPENKEQRVPFLRKASEIMARDLEKLKPSEMHQLGLIYFEMGENDKGIDTFHLAISRDPRQSDWQLELIQFLRSIESFDKALDEINVMLRDRPTDLNLRDLRKVIQREAELKKGS